MSSLAREAAVESRAVAAGPIADAGERGSPVFAASDGRRERAMRTLARVAAGMVVLWLVALLAGAAGLGTLPSVPLPHVGQVSGAEPDSMVAPERATGGSPPAEAAPAATQSHRTQTPRRPARSPAKGERPSRRLQEKRPSGVTPRAPLGSPTASPQETPGHSGASHGQKHPPAVRGPKEETGKPSANPGSYRASPSASALEHSSRWGAGRN